MGLREDPAGLMAPPFDGALFRAVKSAGLSVVVLHGLAPTCDLATR